MRSTLFSYVPSDMIHELSVQQEILPREQVVANIVLRRTDRNSIADTERTKHI